jgi:hypothetical protein
MLAAMPAGIRCEVGDEPALATIRASVQYHSPCTGRLPRARNTGTTMRTKNLLSKYKGIIISLQQKRIYKCANGTV